MGCGLVACLALGTGLARAEQKLYSLEIPDARATTFEIPFEVRHPGEVGVRANWSGRRALAFRIEPPGGAGTTIRRNGPPPIEIRMPVTAAQLGRGPWTLIVHALPVRGAAKGRLTIDLPGPPAPAPEEAPPPGWFPPQSEEPREPWQQPRTPPTGVSAELLRFVRSTESLRELLVDVEPRSPDSCRWQDHLLRWLATRRDLAVDEHIEPEAETGELMDRLAQAIRSVDELRISNDPMIVGPVPSDKRLRAKWERLRSQRLAPVKEDLDDLLTSVQRNHAPELEGEQWPLRMVSCLTAVERHFDQRWISGDRAPNRDLAEAQWLPFNHAAGALEALAELAKEDVIRLRSRR